MSKSIKFGLSRNDKIAISGMSKADKRHYIDMMIEGAMFAEETKNRRGRREVEPEEVETV